MRLIFLQWGIFTKNSSRTDAKEILYIRKNICEVKHKYIHSMITGTYKDEYGDGLKWLAY